VAEDFWSRVKRSQGPRLDFGSFLYDGSQLYGKPPQQTTNWGQVPQAKESGTAWQYQSGNPFGMDWSQAGEATTSVPTAPGVGVNALAGVVNGQARMGQGQSGQQQVANATTPPVPAGSGVGVGALGPLVTGQAGGGGGASWSGQDYKLPSGEVLPGNASFTLDIGGQQVRMPGYYDPASATGGKPAAIFKNGTYDETAIQRFQRRMLDAKNRGENINDPNVIYREMARVRDDAAVAIGSSDPAALRAATGFVHLDRFVRGANGETGYTSAAIPGQQGGNTVDPYSPLNNQAQPGQASGAPATAPGQQMGQPGGQGSTDYNLYLQNNKVGRMAELLTRLGLGTPQRQRSFVGSTLANTYTDLFDPWMQTQGFGSNANVADNFSNLMDNFVGKMQGSGGMGAIAGDANAAIQAITGGGSKLAQGLGDTELFGLLKGFNQLANTPMNPWMQQAYGNLSDDALFSYAQQQGNRLKTGGVDDATAQTLLQFLQGDPRFGFLTGQGR
jgi:hypothetical protein